MKFSCSKSTGNNTSKCQDRVTLLFRLFYFAVINAMVLGRPCPGSILQELQTENDAMGLVQDLAVIQ